nr:MAG TPA: hypothetical protein [Caudoviricetes sp.]
MSISWSLLFCPISRYFQAPLWNRKTLNIII